MEDVVYYETKKDDSNKTVYYIVNKDEDVMVLEYNSKTFINPHNYTTIK